MKLIEALEILHEVNGKGYSWLKAWGLSTIRAAIRTVLNRKSATINDKQLAENVQTKLSRRY